MTIVEQGSFCKQHLRLEVSPIFVYCDTKNSRTPVSGGPWVVNAPSTGDNS